MPEPMMIPQGYPMTIELRLNKPGEEWLAAPVIGWMPVEDLSLTDTLPGARYAPVVMLDGDPFGAWPVPTDGSWSWRLDGLSRVSG